MGGRGTRELRALLAGLVVATVALVAPSSASSSQYASYSATFGYSGPAGIYPYGMAYDKTTNTVIVGDYWNYRVWRFTADGTQQGTVSKRAPLGQPGGICVPYGIDVDPSGNIWVADQNCSRVVEFSSSGNWIRTIGRGGTPSYGFGCGDGKLNVPTYVKVDPQTRNVYVDDPKCGNVYAYSPSGSYLFAFDWTGSNLGVKPLATGVTEDSAGNVYVLEHNSRRIVVFDRQGHWLRNFPSNGSLDDVRGLSIDNTNHVIYATSAYHNMVFEYSTGGALLKTWSGSGSTPFDSLRYSAADDKGDVWVSDGWGYRVWKFGLNGNPLTWNTGPQPPPNGGYNYENGVAVTPDRKLFVVDTYEQRIQAFDSTSSCVSKLSCTAWLYQWGDRSENITLDPGGFNYPHALAYGGGYLWMGDNGNAVIQYLPDGTFVRRIGSKGSKPGQFLGGVQGVAFANGDLYATDVTNCRLQIFDTSGNLLSSMGACGSSANQMQWPRGVAVLGSRAYVFEASRNDIVVWNTTTKTTVQRLAPTCGGVGLSGALDGIFDPSNTWLYVADTGHQRVVRMAADGSNCQVVATSADLPNGGMGNTRYLTFGPDGRLFVSTSARHVYAFRITG
jgi:tripartite motif-containing protein 71